MEQVSIHEAKAKLSALIAQVERLGDKITICRYGRPVAELAPVKHGSRTQVDPELAKVVVKGDLTQATTDEWEDV
jgi:prevent-host-death family protein